MIVCSCQYCPKNVVSNCHTEGPFPGKTADDFFIEVPIDTSGDLLPPHVSHPEGRREAEASLKANALAKRLVGQAPLQATALRGALQRQLRIPLRQPLLVQHTIVMTHKSFAWTQIVMQSFFFFGGGLKACTEKPATRNDTQFVVCIRTWNDTDIL